MSQVATTVASINASIPNLSVPIGSWMGDREAVYTEPDGIAAVLRDIRQPIYIVINQGRLALASGGTAQLKSESAEADGESLPLLGFIPAVTLSQLGDAGFCGDHGIRYAYMTGAMANGIASVELVQAAAKGAVLGSYGAAGQSIELVSSAIDRLLGPEAASSDTDASSGSSGPPHPGICFNLIHSPNEQEHEAAVVDLFLRRGVRRIEASAYLRLTAPVVRYRVTGLKRLADGRVYAPNQIIAKASRIEVATRWFSPPPESLLKDLVAEGGITAQEAELAQFIPMAQDMTAEADSGGHTDNRAAVTLIPTLIALRDRMQAEHGYDVPLRVGAAGGIATPASAAAALAMGAAYIVTGSVNQACVESGSSDEVRKMLAETEQADVTMAPAADMFEMGVKLQVLKRGTMFAIRAGKLYELYRAYEGLDELPDQQRRFLEEKIFRASLDEIWQQTRQFFLERDPGQVDRAMTDAKHKMALVFRWYLGMSSTWANQGVSERKIDYQVWCGSAMGAFNEWVKATFLEAPENRRAVTVAMNILYGTAVMKRIDAARWQGMGLPAKAIRVAPSTLKQLEEYIR